MSKDYYKTPLLTRFLWWLFGERMACRYDIGWRDGYEKGYFDRVLKEQELQELQKMKRNGKNDK